MRVGGVGGECRGDDIRRERERQRRLRDGERERERGVEEGCRGRVCITKVRPCQIVGAEGLVR